MENTFIGRRKKKIDYLELEENGELVVRTTDNMPELLAEIASFVNRLYNIVADDPRICVISIITESPYANITTECYLPVYEETEIIEGPFIITKQGVGINNFLSLNNKEKDLLIRSLTASMSTNVTVECVLNTSRHYD